MRQGRGHPPPNSPVCLFKATLGIGALNPMRLAKKILDPLQGWCQVAFPELARQPSLCCASLSIVTALGDLTDRTRAPLAGSGGFVQSPGSI